MIAVLIRNKIDAQLACSCYISRFHFYKKIRDENERFDPSQKVRRDAETVTRDKFDESVRLTRFHDLYRDAYGIGTCYMHASQGREEKWCRATKFLWRCFYVIECKKTAAGTGWRKTYGRKKLKLVQVLRCVHPRAYVRRVQSRALPSPLILFRIYFHSFPFVGIILTAEREEWKIGKQWRFAQS